MKKLLIFLFLLLSITLLGQENALFTSKKSLDDLLKTVKVDYNLARGFEVNKDFDITDFSKAVIPTTTNQASYTVNSEAIVPFSTDYWYTQDFANDPFNGMIEVYVVGEPLPTPFITLFIASIIAFTFSKYRKLHNKPETQEIF